MLLYTTVTLALVIIGQRVQADMTAVIEKTFEACTGIFTSEFLKVSLINSCCERDNTIQLQGDSDIKCSKPGPDEEWKCEHTDCEIKRYGVLMENGEIDFKKVEEIYDEYLKLNPSTKPLVEMVKEKCSKERVPLIGRECPSLNLISCMFAVNLVECPKWKEDERCSIVAEKVKTCKNAEDQIKANQK